MPTFLKSFAGRRVLITGHTGFKGSWLSEWLIGLGAQVWGFSLPPTTKPALFRQLGLADRLSHTVGDLRDADAIARVLAAARPDYVFHLAAQPIVRTAHSNPAETWATNVMGTVNLLEGLRRLKHPCAAVIVTTDKVYRSSPNARSEDHPVGANDPYGGSKAAVEIAVESWRQAYFPVPSARGRGFPRVAIATARSGNVIGGGDWARDRLIPDCIRALLRGEPIDVRNPLAVRPWQHVLDPLAGYLILGAELRDTLEDRRIGKLSELSGAFNFGPAAADHHSVREVVAEVLKRWPGRWRKVQKRRDPPETGVLRLDAKKAHRLLGWRPRWKFAQALDHTVSWYQYASSPSRALEKTLRQLAEYTSS
jgi:CDP-glucose 4,6-dehydratase